MELIGRGNELDLVTSRLSDRRLVTVIGPGGIGKTSLARAVAEAMAAQLGFPSFAALIGSPTEQSVLLLVDNCEHVTDAAASAISELLAACEAPTVLATSRSPLDLAGEAVVVLGPLELPTQDLVDPEVASVRLFLDRARDAGAVVPESELSVVGEVCRRLDGLPLALEIAAARTRSMTPSEILGHLGGPFDVLHRPRFRGAARHRSLRATTDWSYRLLDGADAVLFDRLGVFAGPFTASMAHAVAAERGASEIQTLEQLDGLVAASLVVADRDGHTTWYRLLDTLRGFAVEQLEGRGELSRTWERFVDHVVEAAEAIIDRARESWQASVLGELLALHDNISAAIRWCVANDTEPDRALRLVTVLWGVVHQGHTSDVADLGERVLERVLQRWRHPGSPPWADAAATVATCRYLLGQPEQAIALAEEALPVAAASSPAAVTLRRVMGMAWRALGETERPLLLFAEGAAEARVRGLVGLAMELDVARALVTADAGQLADALGLVRASRDEAAQRDSDINQVFAASAEGCILLRQDPDAAVAVIEEALAAARGIGYPAGVSANLRSLALGHLAAGRLDDAARSTLELVDELVGRGDIIQRRVMLDTVAVVLERSGVPAWADIAATAASLPIASLMASVGHELFPLPELQARPLPAPEAVMTARRELLALLDRRATPPPVRPISADEAVFHRVGDFWDIRYVGRSAHLKSTKGMQDLARLLAEPGRELHCLDLMGAGVRHDSTGEVLDETARRQYEQRIRDLQAEIDEAQDDHDDARAEGARVELDALVDHLASALGLGGRARRSGDIAERARSAVTQRLRSTMRRIADVHPPLGRHLESSIRTGIYCSYRPEHPVPWRS